MQQQTLLEVGLITMSVIHASGVQLHRMLMAGFPRHCDPCFRSQTAAVWRRLRSTRRGGVLKPSYGRRVALHESGHFLVAYLLGWLPRAYTLSSLDAFRTCAAAAQLSRLSCGLVGSGLSGCVGS